MKFLFTLSIFITLNVFSQNQFKNKDLKVDSVTKMTTHAGVRGGGSTVSYMVYLTIKSNKIKSFDSAWAMEQGGMIITRVNKTSKNTLKFKRKQKIALMIEIRYNHSPLEEMKYQTIPTPVKSNDELIVRYKKKNKIQYFTINQFIVKPTIAMP